MIFGIGTDIVKVARMEASLRRFGDRFVARILAEQELLVFRQAKAGARFLAKRFAAKEAAVKAMGTGFSNGIGLKQISVEHEDGGRPTLAFEGIARDFLRQRQIQRVHLSLSDEQDYVVAFVTMEQEGTQARPG